MKRLKSSLFAGLTALLFLLPKGEASSLPEISNPYLGAYECKRATFGGSDLLEHFDEVTLELVDETHYRLLYKEKGASRREKKGEYSFDPATRTLTFDTGEGKCPCFPLQEGILTVSFPVGGKQLVLRFEHK